MLAIRLQRVGRKKLPIYRVVVSEKTKDTYGDHLEILGTYNPHTKEANLKVDRIKHWLDNGAQSSDSVHNLFLKEGVVEGKKAKAVAISNKRRAKLEGEKEAPKEEAAPADAEKPAEEATEEKADAPAEAKEEAPAEEAKEESKEENK